MAKAKTPSYTLTLSLLAQPFQIHILEKRFEIARKLYNQYLCELLKRKKMLEHDSEYKEWIKKEKSNERVSRSKEIE